MDLATVSYSGVVSPSFFVEARLSARNETLKNVGATVDRSRSTARLLVDQSRAGRRYWAPTFCGVCDPEERDNQDVFVKGSYFLSKEGVGSHNLIFGYDGFNDRRFANNHQSGSDYRILGTSAIVDGGGRSHRCSSATARRSFSGVRLSWQRGRELPRALRLLQRYVAGLAARHREPRLALRPESRRQQRRRGRRERQRVQPASRRHLGSRRHPGMGGHRELRSLRGRAVDFDGECLFGGRQRGFVPVRVSRAVHQRQRCGRNRRRRRRSNRCSTGSCQRRAEPAA